MTLDHEKRAAAEAAVALVEDGMVVGLGTGSTAAHAVRALGARLSRDALKIRAVPTSEATRKLAESLGIPLIGLDEVDLIDLTIDGADEIDGQLRMIKGGGGALLREKLVAAASFHVAIIVDSSKTVDRLGAFPLPVEALPFGVMTTSRAVAAIGHDFGLPPGGVKIRAGADGSPFITDQGNYILDLSFGRIADAAGLAQELDHITGIVEHGLFLDEAHRLFVGRGDEVEEIARSGVL